MTTLSATKLVFGIVLAIGLVIASIERVEALDYPVKNLRDISCCLSLENDGSQHYMCTAL